MNEILKTPDHLPPLRFKEPTLIIMFGIPGSGKSAFARRLAETAEATVWINGDSMQQARDYAGGDRGAAEGRDENWWPRMQVKYGHNYNYDHHVASALKQGLSVIRDYSHNRRQQRDSAREMAGVERAVIVCLETPTELAVQRGSQREINDHQYRLKPETMRRHIENKKQIMENPGGDELSLTIDGQLDFAEQYLAFLEFCRKQELTDAEAGG